MTHRDSPLAARTRRLLHLDVDAFLASVESSREPALRGKPLIIGAAPNTRGLVMSCSYEARAFGVRSGMFSHEAAARCPEAIFRPGNSGAANALRAQLATLLLRFTPVVEISSIDDFFLDLRGTTRLMGAACQVAEAIQRAASEELHVPVTIGIGTNKTIARLAGKLGKPRGIAEVLPGQEAAFMTHLPIHHVPGVGHAIRRYLADFAIRTVDDLRQVSKEVLFASFGTNGLTLYDRVRGIDTDPVAADCLFDEHGLLIHRTPKSIHRDSSFEPEEGRIEQIEAMLAYLVDRAADRLRSHRLFARSMEVRLRYVDTRAARKRGGSQNHASADSASKRLRRKLPDPTNQTDPLWHHARALLHELPRRRALVKRVGVSLLTLEPARAHQYQLFSDPESDRPVNDHRTNPDSEQPPTSRADRDRTLDQVLDQLRGRHGFGSVVRGAALPLVQNLELGEDGFRLRTPSLNQ